MNTRILLVVCFTLVLLGCGSNSNSLPEHTIFRYNEHANITSLDPAFAKDQRNGWACHQLYNKLVQLDTHMQVQPDAAKSWEISQDGLEYMFTLREDIYFHKHNVFGKDSTRALTAKDVVFSLQRLTDPKVASPGSWIMQKVKNIQALTNHKVAITLTTPFPAFLSLLSMQYTGLVPVEMKQLDFTKTPIGTGPFYMKRWIPNEKLVLRKNKRYFEKDEKNKALPYLEAVAITFLPDKQSEFMQFAQGKLDFISGLDASYKDALLTPSGNLQPSYSQQFKMQKSPYLNTEYIGIYQNGDNKALQSKKFRQALNYGINRRELITYLRNGIGSPATHGFIPKGLTGFLAQEKFPYQPQKARKLLEEFKQETGISQPSITISTNPSYLDLIEFLQKEWQQLGIEVAIEVMPPSTLLQQRSAGKLALFRSSWIADYPDAENYLSLFYSPNFSPFGPNYTHFSNAHYDSLYVQSLSINTIEERSKLYQKMDSIVVENAPFVALYYDEVVRFSQQNVHGLGINSFNLLELKRVYKTLENEF